MSQEQVSDDFDWVAAQAKCTASVMFGRLRAVASGSTGFKTTALVRFERDGRRIHVQGENVEVEFTAVVTLDVTGLCRFVVGEAMYSDWEIRRMALEQLFFEEDDSE